LKFLASMVFEIKCHVITYLFTKSIHPCLVMLHSDQLSASLITLWLFAHFGIVQKQTNIDMVTFRLVPRGWFLCCMTYCIVSTLCIVCAVLCSLGCALTTVRLLRGHPQPSLHRRTNHREYNVHVGHIARPWLSVFILCAQCNLCNHIF